MSYPLPGTPFHDQVKAQLGSKTRWQESNDLEMMFDGTYGSEFYRSVRELLHAQVDAQQLQAAQRDDDFQRARQLLLRGWENLVQREPQYRRDANDALDSGSILAV